MTYTMLFNINHSQQSSAIATSKLTKTVLAYILLRVFFLKSLSSCFLIYVRFLLIAKCVSEFNLGAFKDNECLSDITRERMFWTQLYYSES